MDGLSAIAFAQPAAHLPELCDEDFLKSIAWRPGSPKALSAAARRGDEKAFGLELQTQLRCAASGRVAGVERQRIPRIPTSGGSLRSIPATPATPPWEWQSLWSRHAFDETPRAVTLFRLLENLSQRSIPRRRQVEIADWFSQQTAENPISPHELLGLFELMLEAGHQLPCHLGWRLWRVALTAAIQLSSYSGREVGVERQRTPKIPTSGGSLRSTPATPATPYPDQQLLVWGEVPWQAGLLFDHVKGGSAFRRSGQRNLRRELLERTDTDGTPQAELLERLGWWLAPLVRATSWAKRFRVELWDEEADERFADLVKAVSLLCDAGGRLALANGSPCSAGPLLRSASQLAGRKGLLSFLAAVGNGAGQRKSRVPHPRSRGRAPLKRPIPQTHGHASATAARGDSLPVAQSDWARLACLRNHWTVDADTLVVAHHREKPEMELTALGKPLMSGVWDIAITIDGDPLEFRDEWSCVCWNSDEDADYLELQATFERLRVERQLLLSRHDHFALFADSISGAEPATIEYTSRLPLVDGVDVDSDVPTRECVLKDGKRLARAFPLSLPQDRVLSAPGQFGPAGGAGLELQQTALGGVYAPVVVDWDPTRRRHLAEWQNLTVTEQRRKVEPDIAAGHRLRIGRHQLVIYRSLRNSGNSRAVLGLHTFYETVIGRFDTSGNVLPLVMVEPGE